MSHAPIRPEVGPITLNGLRWPLLAGLLAVGVLTFMPQGHLACDDPMGREVSPDGSYSVTLCYRPMWIAMPGGGGDGGAWAVLRDRAGVIQGVVDVRGPYQSYGPAEWSPTGVALPMVAGFDLVGREAAPLRWLRDRVWRVRALVRLVPSSDDFH